MPPYPFTFLGFPPPKSGRRRRFFERFGLEGLLEDAGGELRFGEIASVERSGEVALGSSEADELCGFVGETLGEGLS